MLDSSATDVVRRLRNREIFGQRSAVFTLVPPRLQHCLLEIADPEQNILSVILLGFVRGGEFLVSYTADCDTIAASIYSVQLWRFPGNGEGHVVCTGKTGVFELSQPECSVHIVELHKDYCWKDASTPLVVWGLCETQAAFSVLRCTREGQLQTLQHHKFDRCEAVLGPPVLVYGSKQPNDLDESSWQIGIAVNTATHVWFEEVTKIENGDGNVLRHGSFCLDAEDILEEFLGSVFKIGTGGIQDYSLQLIDVCRPNYEDSCLPVGIMVLSCVLPPSHVRPCTSVLQIVMACRGRRVDCLLWRTVPGHHRYVEEQRQWGESLRSLRTMDTPCRTLDNTAVLRHCSLDFLLHPDFPIAVVRSHGNEVPLLSNTHSEWDEQFSSTKNASDTDC